MSGVGVRTSVVKWAVAFIAAGLTSACASGPVVKSIDINASGGPQATQSARVAGYYALPSAFYPLSLKRDKKGVTEVKFGDAKYVPDPSRLYAISYLTDDWSSDQITIETDGLGLLKVVAPKSEDVTGEIAKKVIELAKTVAALGAQIPMHGVAPPPALKACKAGAIARDYWLDPGAGAAELGATAERIYEETCFLVEVSPVRLNTPPAFDAVNCPPDSSATNATACVDGIFYRPALPFEIRVTDLAPKVPVARTFLAMAPTADVTLVATLNRKAVTGLHTTLSFSNGMLTKFESTDPNQAVAALQIPIDVLKAIAAIPGEILTVKVKNIKDETGYLEAQRAYFEATKSVLAAQAEAEAAAAARARR